MHLPMTPALGRRRLLLGGAATAAAASLPGCRAGAEGAALPVTPAQTRGPFYPSSFPPDTDNDLVVQRGWEARAEGVVAHVVGRVLTVDGAPLPGARVEIWQCDARGVYLHPSSDRTGVRDAAFQGFGRAVAGVDGGYAFRTIRPVAYPGRTPHIHFAVAAPGRPELVTQMYVAGDPANERDGIYRRLGARGQGAVTVRLDDANGVEPGALAGRFDIVLA